MTATFIPAEADDLMERYAAGDARAFAALHALLAPWLTRHLRRVSGADAEDLLQQTFLKLHAARATYRRGSPVAPWVLVMAKRLAIDVKRSARVTLDADDLALASREPLPDAWLQAAQTAARVDAALARLPLTQARALLLTRLDGIGLEGAALRLGTTIMGVKLRTHRATSALRDALDKPDRPRLDRARPRCDARVHERPDSVRHEAPRAVA